MGVRREGEEWGGGREKSGRREGEERGEEGWPGGEMGWVCWMKDIICVQFLQVENKLTSIKSEC